MDLLNLIKAEELADFAKTYSYGTQFKGQQLFPSRKTDNLKLAYRSLVEGGDLPVMAQVHALDAESRIGDRTNFKEIEVEKLLIKEKLNQGERVAYYLRNGGRQDGVSRFIFDDVANLKSRVITRTEVANMEVLSTGKMTIDENNVKLVVDYGFKAENRINGLQWSDPTHDILGDLEKIQDKANNNGFEIVRAYTSSKIVQYMYKNNAIRAIWSNSSNPITVRAMLTWLVDNFGIEFVALNDVYKLSANATEKKRFFDENAVTFVATRGALGVGFYAPTPEEIVGIDGTLVSAGNIAIAMWKQNDPAGIWTKASAVYLPVIKDIDKMFIAKIK